MSTHYILDIESQYIYMHVLYIYIHTDNTFTHTHTNLSSSYSSCKPVPHPRVAAWSARLWSVPQPQSSFPHFILSSLFLGSPESQPQSEATTLHSWGCTSLLGVHFDLGGALCSWGCTSILGVHLDPGVHFIPAGALHLVFLFLPSCLTGVTDFDFLPALTGLFDCQAFTPFWLSKNKTRTLT